VQTSVKGPFRLRENRRIRSWKLSAGVRKAAGPARKLTPENPSLCASALAGLEPKAQPQRISHNPAKVRLSIKHLAPRRGRSLAIVLRALSPGTGAADGGAGEGRWIVPASSRVTRMITRS
jgi:hypothetical protein